MNFIEFIKLLKEHNLQFTTNSMSQTIVNGLKKILPGKSGVEAILSEDLGNPKDYLDNVRKHIKAMIDDGVTGSVGSYALNDLYNMLNPEVETGKEFFKSIPGAKSYNLFLYNIGNAKDLITSILSDSKKLNFLIEKSGLVNILADSKYYDTSDFVAYMSDRECVFGDVYLKNETSNILNYLRGFFGKDEMYKYGYTENVVNDTKGQKLRGPVILFIVMLHVQSELRSMQQKILEDSKVIEVIEFETIRKHRDYITDEQLQQVSDGMKARRGNILDDHPGALTGSLDEFVEVMRITSLTALFKTMLYDGLSDFNLVNEYLLEGGQIKGVTVDCPYQHILINSTKFDAAKPVKNHHELNFIDDDLPFRTIDLRGIENIHNRLTGDVKSIFKNLPRHRQFYIAAVAHAIEQKIFERFSSKMNDVVTEMGELGINAAGCARRAELEKKFFRLQETKKKIFYDVLQSLTPAILDRAFAVASVDFELFRLKEPEPVEFSNIKSDSEYHDELIDDVREQSEAVIVQEDNAKVKDDIAEKTPERKRSLDSIFIVNIRRENPVTTEKFAATSFEQPYHHAAARMWAVRDGECNKSVDDGLKNNNKTVK